MMPDPGGKVFWYQSVPTELSFEELHLEDWLLDQGKALPLHFVGRGRTNSNMIIQAECLQLFVDKGMQVPTIGPSGEPLLFEAVAQGDVAVVEQLLRLGADTTATNEYGETALFCLPHFLSADYLVDDVANLARVLLDAGVDAAVESNRPNGGTALHRWLAAATRATPDAEFGLGTVATLLMTGVNVDARNSRGETLYYAPVCHRVILTLSSQSTR